MYIRTYVHMYVPQTSRLIMNGSAHWKKDHEAWTPTGTWINNKGHTYVCTVHTYVRTYRKDHYRPSNSTREWIDKRTKNRQNIHLQWEQECAGCHSNITSGGGGRGLAACNIPCTQLGCHGNRRRYVVYLVSTLGTPDHLWEDGSRQKMLLSLTHAYTYIRIPGNH